MPLFHAACICSVPAFTLTFWRALMFNYTRSNEITPRLLFVSHNVPLNPCHLLDWPKLTFICHMGRGPLVLKCSFVGPKKNHRILLCWRLLFSLWAFTNVCWPLWVTLGLATNRQPALCCWGPGLAMQATPPRPSLFNPKMLSDPGENGNDTWAQSVLMMAGFFPFPTIFY